VSSQVGGLIVRLLASERCEAAGG